MLAPVVSSVSSSYGRFRDPDRVATRTCGRIGWNHACGLLSLFACLTLFEILQATWATNRVRCDGATASAAEGDGWTLEYTPVTALRAHCWIFERRIAVRAQVCPNGPASRTAPDGILVAGFMNNHHFRLLASLRNATRTLFLSRLEQSGALRTFTIAFVDNLVALRTQYLARHDKGFHAFARAVRAVLAILIECPCDVVPAVTNFERRRSRCPIRQILKIRVRLG